MHLDKTTLFLYSLKKLFCILNMFKETDPDQILFENIYLLSKRTKLTLVPCFYNLITVINHNV